MPTHSSHEPSVPANYFGRGENFNLAELSPDELRKFESDFREYESKHQSDPTGEIALAEWKRGARTRPKSVPAMQVVVIPSKDVPKMEFPKPDGLDPERPVELELTLPAHLIKKLKDFAKFKTRRPRDIVAKLIEDHCHLN